MWLKDHCTLDCSYVLPLPDSELICGEECFLDEDVSPHCTSSCSEFKSVDSRGKCSLINCNDRDAINDGCEAFSGDLCKITNSDVSSSSFCDICDVNEVYLFFFIIFFFIFLSLFFFFFFN
jgi:hypothetical protein